MKIPDEVKENLSNCQCTSERSKEWMKHCYCNSDQSSKGLASNRAKEIEGQSAHVKEQGEDGYIILSQGREWAIKKKVKSE
jgi:hypothetical protein